MFNLCNQPACSLADLDGNIYLIMELVSGGTLLQAMKDRAENNKPFSEEEVRKAMMNILKAVNYLHNENFVHRDIKPGELTRCQ